MAELAYAYDSGSYPCIWVWVQVPLSAGKRKVVTFLFLFSGKDHLISGREMMKRLSAFWTRNVLHTRLNMNLVLSVVFINIIGIIMIYSASYHANTEDPEQFFISQIKYVFYGLALAYVISKVRPSFYQPKSVFMIGLFYFGCVAFVMILLIPGFGVNLNNATRWVKIPGTTIQFQVAEPLKVLYVLTLSAFASRYRLRRDSFWVIFIGASFLALLVYRISENLSTAIILFGMMYIYLLVMYPKNKGLIWFGIIVVVCIALFLLFFDKIKPYEPGEKFRWTRIRAWLDPQNPLFALDEAYQGSLGAYAIASGGLLGKGLGQGLVKLTLPEAMNDFILAIISEELGLFGVLLLTYLFIYMLYCIYKVFRETKGRYEKSLVLCILSHLVLQIIINYAVVYGLMPTTGVTLPFVSAGGSAAFFTLIEIGIVLAVDRENKEDELYKNVRTEMQSDDPYYKKLSQEQGIALSEPIRRNKKKRGRKRENGHE